ncbi:MAG: hypothetical protein PHX83_12180 [Acidobacteriia bacterium]|nr:hypothetical protein [Terriglobia bacterium]
MKRFFFVLLFPAVCFAQSGWGWIHPMRVVYDTPDSSCYENTGDAYWGNIEVYLKPDKKDDGFIFSIDSSFSPGEIRHAYHAYIDSSVTFSFDTKSTPFIEINRGKDVLKLFIRGDSLVVEGNLKISSAAKQFFNFVFGYWREH